MVRSLLVVRPRFACKYAGIYGSLFLRPLFRSSLQSCMEKPAAYSGEYSRWGHPKLLRIVAEILGRNITLIMPQPHIAFGYNYTPGFASTFGTGGQAMDDDMYGVC